MQQAYLCQSTSCLHAYRHASQRVLALTRECHLQPTGYITDEMAHVQTLNGKLALFSCHASGTSTLEQHCPEEKLSSLSLWYS